MKTPHMRSTIRIVSLLLLVTGVEGHALWQQTVRSSNLKHDGQALITLLNFAERPGLAQVEREYMAKKEYEAGVSLFMRRTSYDPFEPLTQLPVVLAGKFIAAPLPDALSGGGSYVLESSVRSGLWAEGDAAPSLSVFYTSASRHADGQAFPPAASANRLRVDLRRVPGAAPPAVEAVVTYDGARLPDAEVRILDGVTGEDLATQATDAGGTATFAVSPLDERVFAKVKHLVETPGATTERGEAYDTVNNVATSILELSESMPYVAFDLPEYDTGPSLAEEGEEVAVLKNTGTSSFTDSASTLIVVFAGVGLVSVGFFLGVVAAKKCRRPQIIYEEALDQDIV